MDLSATFRQSMRLNMPGILHPFSSMQSAACCHAHPVMCILSCAYCHVHAVMIRHEHALIMLSMLPVLQHQRTAISNPITAHQLSSPSLLLRVCCQ